MRKWRASVARKKTGCPISAEAQGRPAASTLPMSKVGNCAKNARCGSGM